MILLIGFLIALTNRLKIPFTILNRLLNVIFIHGLLAIIKLIIIRRYYLNIDN